MKNNSAQYTQYYCTTMARLGRNKRTADNRGSFIFCALKLTFCYIKFFLSS